jgi:hypothetical protein
VASIVHVGDESVTEGEAVAGLAVGGVLDTYEFGHTEGVNTIPVHIQRGIFASATWKHANTVI